VQPQARGVDHDRLETQSITWQHLGDRLLGAFDQRPDTIGIERTDLDLVADREDLGSSADAFRRRNRAPTLRALPPTVSL
jgi:hypothetical protein